MSKTRKSKGRSVKIVDGQFVQITATDYGAADLFAEQTALDNVTVSVGYQGRLASAIKDERVRRVVSSDAGGKRGVHIVPNAKGVTVVDVANQHEFGLGVPRRATLGPAVRKNVDKLQTMQRRVVANMLRGRNWHQSVRRVGVFVEGEVKNEIVALRSPPLAESTKQKRFDLTGDRDPNPLIDTAQMKNSVTNVVDGI